MNTINNFRVMTDQQNTIAFLCAGNGNRINLFCRCAGSCQDPESCTKKMERKIKTSAKSGFNVNDPDFSVVYLERMSNNGFRVNNKLSS